MNIRNFVGGNAQRVGLALTLAACAAPVRSAGEGGAGAPAPPLVWAVVVPDGAAGAALTLSSQGGGDPALSDWVTALAAAASAANPEDPDAEMTRRCRAARPTALAEGAPVTVLTATGAEVRRLEGCTATFTGTGSRVTLKLAGPLVPSWSLAAVRGPAPRGSRFVALTAAPATPALAARVRAQLVALLGATPPAALPDPLPEDQATFYAAPLGAAGAGLVALCLERPAGGEDAMYEGRCVLGALALVDAAGQVTGWLRSYGEDGPWALPTVRGIVPEDTYGTTTPLGVLVVDGRVAVLTSLNAVGNEVYDLLHLDADGVRAERLFTLVIE